MTSVCAFPLYSIIGLLLSVLFFSRALILEVKLLIGVLFLSVKLRRRFDMQNQLKTADCVQL